MRQTYIKRMGLGVAAMIGTGILLDLLVPRVFEYEALPEQFLLFQLLPSLESAAKIGFVVFVGAYVAGVRFVVPGIAYFLFVSIVASQILVLLSQVVEPVSFAEVAVRNLPGTALGLATVIFAAEMGFRLSFKRTETTS